MHFSLLPKHPLPGVCLVTNKTFLGCAESASHENKTTNQIAAV